MMHSVLLGWIPRGPAIAICGRSTSCTAGASWPRASMRNVHGDRVEIRQATALALPFQDGIFDHVWSYAVTMNIADKAGLAREVARVLKPGGRFSCNEIEQGAGGARYFLCL